MSGIHVYNITKDDYSGNENNYLIHRPYILGNPYTDIKDRNTKARFVVKDRDTAIEKYSEYFDIMYGGDKDFKAAVDEIYERYKAGEDVYLGCYCKPKRCHGDIIVDKLRKRLIKEKLKAKI